MNTIDDNYEIALNFLLNKGVTAYELNKFSGQSEAGLRKLLNGLIENPRRKTKEVIIEYYNYLKDKEVFLASSNKEYTKGLEKFTPNQISTYISENIDKFKTEELMQILFEKSILKEANRLVEEKLNNINSGN